MAGCGNIYDKIIDFNETLDQMALTYMQEKYGESFSTPPQDQAVHYYPNMASGSVRAIPETHPEWIITVKFQQPREGEFTFTDNYVGFLIRDELAAFYLPYVQQVYGEEVITFVGEPGTISRPAEFDKNTTAEEYALGFMQAGCRIYTASDPEQRDAKAEELWQIMNSNGFAGTYKIYYMTQEVLEEITVEALRAGTRFPYMWQGVLYSSTNSDNPYEPVKWYN